MAICQGYIGGKGDKTRGSFHIKKSVSGVELIEKRGNFKGPIYKHVIKPAENNQPLGIFYTTTKNQESCPCCQVLFEIIWFQVKGWKYFGFR